MSLIKRKEKSNKGLSSSSPVKRFRLGVASLVAAILAFSIVSGEMAAIQYFQDRSFLLPGFAMLDSILTCFSALLALAGLILGLTAVVRKETKRALGILGLTFNGLFLLLILVLYVINMLALMRAGGT